MVPILGAQVHDGGTTFGLHATTAKRCSVRLYGQAGEVLATHAMESDPIAAGEARGYFHAFVPGVGHGALYQFVIDDSRELPDPCARYLPVGVGGPAMVVESRYAWKHGPGLGRPMSEQVFYELHVGTFSAEGTYLGVAERAHELADLGITAVEVMPVAAFAGQRGWGYDGVAWFAPFAPYGSPDDLRAMVDALHGAGLSVILDVVYNHFGPAGCHLRELDPATFTGARKNAWGDGLDFENPVLRRMVIESALYWLEEFRFDGLRLDAIHAIYDPSPEHILHALAGRVAQLRPRRILVAEDERNEPASLRGLGLDALWADDFHHAVRVSLTGEQDGYFAAYRASLETVAETIEHGWLYRGQRYAPTGKPRGKPAHGLDAAELIYCIQNHDQVGNRALGERLSSVIPIERYRAVSVLLLFLPMTPLLFMGQEWGASSPFLYFTDHDDGLGKLISEGRRREFVSFKEFSDPIAREQIPDPQQRSTFERSRLAWSERDAPAAAQTLRLYRDLIALRHSDPVLRQNTRAGLSATAEGWLLRVTRANREGKRLLALNLESSSLALGDVVGGGKAYRTLLASDGWQGERPLLPASTAVVLAVAD